MKTVYDLLYWALLGVAVASLVGGGLRYYLLVSGPVLADPVPESPSSTSSVSEPSTGMKTENFRPVDQLVMVKSNPASMPAKEGDEESSQDQGLDNLSAQSIKKIERSKLPFELVGTTTGSSGLEFAVLRHLDSQDVRQLRPGESWESLQLTGVAEEYVQILNKQREKKEILELRRSEQSAVKGAQGSSSGKRVSRYQINQAIHRNMNNLLAAVQAQPVLKQGTLVGFRINQFRGKPGRLLKKLGFREGDVIERVNGHKIDSMQKALELWSQLRNKKHFRVAILRNGNEQTLEYTLVR